MATLTRFDDAFDDLLRGFFVRPVGLEGTHPTQAAPAQFRVEVTEGEQAYTLRAEIPGVKKDDIKVSVDGNQVSITAEIKKESEEKKGESVIRSERYYGKQYRAFGLPQDVDPGKTEAKYADGVLELLLPKKAGTAPQQVTVK